MPEGLLGPVSRLPGSVSVAELSVCMGGGGWIKDSNNWSSPGLHLALPKTQGHSKAECQFPLGGVTGSEHKRALSVLTWA